MSNRIQITDEIILMFKENSTALIIWADIMLQINKNSSFIPRRKNIKKKFNLGNVRMNKAINFLKAHGLAETFPIYFRGRMTGAQYKFYSLENAVDNPTISITPGPQAKTRVIAEMKPRTPLNGNNSECLKNEHSENSSLIKFNSQDPDEHKKTFLEYFPGQNTFQVFDDSKKKRRNLSKVYQKYNPLELDAKNNQGAGIFLTINKTDSKGRSRKNITRVRAVFADLDGAPLEPVMRYGPSLVVESSPGRYHAYWMTDNVPMESFTGLQKAIANRFKSDPKIKDLARVMRIPGYYHCKQDPFLSKILYTSKNKYSFDELKKMFSEKKSSVVEIHGVSKNERNNKLCQMIGGMVKSTLPQEKIRKQAYKFAETCTPKLSKNQVDSTLKAAENWK